MLVTELGIVNEVNAEAPLNALYPISVTVSPSVKEDSFEQPLKALFGINDASILREVSVVHIL